MEKKILMFIVLSLSATFLAQAQVTRFSIDAMNNSIVRSVNEEYNLIYTETSTSQGWFILHHNGATMAQMFFLPNGIRVRDVRIHQGKTAYFCGTSGSHGVVGYFHILPVFAGTSTINYTICFEPLPPDVTMRPSDLKRLDLFEQDGKVIMAMVGDSYVNLGLPIGSTTVTSAWYDTSWHMCSFLNKGDYIRFTDIACLDHTIVAIGTNTNGEGCLLKAYRPIPMFPSAPLTYYSLFSIDFMSPVGDVLAVHTVDDSLAVAHFDNEIGVRTVMHKIEINPTSGIPSSPIDTWLSDTVTSIPYGSGWKMIEIVKEEQNVWLLQNADFPQETGPVFRLTRMAPNTPTMQIGYWKPYIGKPQSMDTFIPSHLPVLSGSGSSLLTHSSSWPQYNVSCQTYAQRQLFPKTATVKSGMIPEDVKYPITPSNVYLPVITELRAEVICNQMNLE